MRRHIEENAERLELPVEFFHTNVLRVAANHAAEHPCFLCAKMRRGHLYTQAQARGCNKIALGHHYDDAIETVLMGLLYGGQVQAMLPRLQSRNYPGMELIRPLYCIKEADIIAWARYHGLSFLQCACRLTARSDELGVSKRQEVKQLIAALKKETPNIEDNIFSSLHAVCLDTMPGYRARGVDHSFLENYAERERTAEEI